MAVFKEKLTIAGKTMYANMLAGNIKITFTKIVMGDGSASEAVISTISKVVNPKATLANPYCKVNGDNTVNIYVLFDNSAVSSGFYFREKGIYATDGTNEILFSYGNVGSLAEWIDPPNTGVVQKKISTIIAYSEGDTINVSINAEGFVPVENGNASQVKLADGTTIEAAIAAVNVSLISQNRGKNLLHNWYFKKPINVRGLTTYTCSGNIIHTIDRWFAGYFTNVTLENESLTLVNQSSKGTTDMTQKLEEDLSGLTVTFSIDIDGVISSKTVDVPVLPALNSVLSGISFSWGAFVLVYFTDKYFGYTIRLNASQSVSGVKRAKIEIGSKSTLANDPPMDYGEELTKCQRYYQRIVIMSQSNGFIWTDNGGQAGMMVLSPKMRLDTPTVGIVGTALAQLRFSNGTIMSDVPLVTTADIRPGVICYGFKKDNNTLPTGAFAYIITSGSADIAVSAEL